MKQNRNTELALDLWVKLARCFSRFNMRTIEHIRQFGLTQAQFGVIECLGHLGPMKVGDLCRKMLVTGGNMTVVLDNLAKLGLIDRTASAGRSQGYCDPAQRKGRRVVSPDLSAARFAHCRTRLCADWKRADGIGPPAQETGPFALARFYKSRFSRCLDLFLANGGFMIGHQMEVRRATERFATRMGWLDSRHCFSFGHHFDPANTHFGLLVVSNDDVVKPGTGFSTHPHRDMEIITWVLDGELEHKDSTGNTGIIVPGDAQRMTAGRGILHSEINPSGVKPVHFPADVGSARHGAAGS